MKEYWIVDPKKHVMVVMRRVRNRWVENVVEPPALYRTRLLPGLEFSCEAVVHSGRADLSDEPRDGTTQETTTATEPVPAPPRRQRLLTALRLLAMALPIAVLVIGAIVLPGWIPVLPRVVRGG